MNETRTVTDVVIMCLLQWVLVCALLLSGIADIAGADSVPPGYRQAKEEIARLERSSLWERIAPSYEHRLSFYPDEFDEVVGPHREDRDLTVSFRPLCETVIVQKEFNRSTHEYRPPFYQEVLCKGNDYRESPVSRPLKNSQMCLYPGYSCIQRKREMFVTRRHFGANCWETVTVTIPSNCECMWPESRKGEIE